MIKEEIQRLLRRWIDEESPLSPRWLVEGEDAQPPDANGVHYAKIRIHFANVHAHSNIIVEIKLKAPFKVSYLPPCLARRGGEVQQDANYCVPRETASLDAVGGHGGHPLPF